MSASILAQFRLLEERVKSLEKQASENKKKLSETEKLLSEERKANKNLTKILKKKKKEERVVWRQQIIQSVVKKDTADLIQNDDDDLSLEDSRKRKKAISKLKESGLARGKGKIILSANAGREKTNVYGWGPWGRDEILENRLVQLKSKNSQIFVKFLREQFFDQNVNVLFGNDVENKNDSDTEKSIKRFYSFLFNVGGRIVKFRDITCFMVQNDKFENYIKDHYSKGVLAKNSGKSAKRYYIPLEAQGDYNEDFFVEYLMSYASYRWGENDDESLKLADPDFNTNVFMNKKEFTSRLFVVKDNVRPEYKNIAGKKVILDYYTTDDGAYYYQLYNPEDPRTNKFNLCFWNCLRFAFKLSQREINKIVKDVLGWEDKLDYKVNLSEIFKVRKYVEEKYKITFSLCDEHFDSIDNGKDLLEDRKVMPARYYFENCGVEDYVEYTVENENELVFEKAHLDNVGILRHPDGSGFPNIFFKHQNEISPDLFNGCTFMLNDDHCSIVVAFAPIQCCHKCCHTLNPDELSGKKKHRCEDVSRITRFKNRSERIYFGDLETRLDSNYKSQEISAQLAYMSDSGEKVGKIFYGLDCLDKFVEELLSYDDFCTVIFHNGSNFDAPILHTYLMNKYPNLVDTDSIILGGGLKSFIFNEKIQVIDSYKHLSSKLKQLCVDFQLAKENSKLEIFEILIGNRMVRMTSEEMLLYGSNPKEKDYLSPEQYLEMLENNPSFKKAFSDYSMNDVYSLMEIWDLYTFALEEIVGKRIRPETFITAPSMAEKLLYDFLKDERRDILLELTKDNKNLYVENGKLYKYATKLDVDVMEWFKENRFLYYITKNKNKKEKISKFNLKDYKEYQDCFEDKNCFYKSKTTEIKIFNSEGDFTDQFCKELNLDKDNYYPIFEKLANTHIVKPEVNYLELLDEQDERHCRKVKTRSKANLFYKQSVIGGISHFLRADKFKGKFVSFDVVSLYPYVMREKLFPYGNGIYLSNEECKERFKDLKQLEKLGIYKCRNIHSNRISISDIPGRDKDGILDWGVFDIEEKILTSVDINRILKHGGSLEIVDGYLFPHSYNPFKNFVDKFFKRKQAEDQKPKKPSNNKDIIPGVQYRNESIRNTCKLILNSLFGKFCRTKNQSKVKYSSSLHEVLSKINVDSWGIDINANKIFYKEEKEVVSCPVQLGSFILAHSRDKMQSLFDLVGRENIYVTETDSIYCEDKHSSELRKLIGNNLGDLTNELTDSDTCMILGKKSYMFENVTYKNEKKPFIMALKGCPSQYVNSEMFNEVLDKGFIKIENFKFWQRKIFMDKVEPGIYIKDGVKTIKLANRKP